MKQPDERTQTPPPGVYDSVPEAEYHRWDAISNSHLTEMARSPLHCRWAIDHPTDPTPAMVFGSAVHVAILEPERFIEEYAIAPTGRRTKEEKEAWAAFEAEHAGKTPLKRDDFGACQAMCKAVMAHPTASAAITTEGRNELSVVWVCPTTEVTCKCRIDRLLDKAMAVDLKTTKDASREAFTKSIGSYGYHRQAAMYLDGAEAAGLHAEEFVIVAVEKTPPYGVAVLAMDEEAIEIGRYEYLQMLEAYAECLSTAQWPGYSDSVVDISVPGWMAARAAALEMYA
jgi:exodeoxyribonuclease VIII